MLVPSKTEQLDLFSNDGKSDVPNASSKLVAFEQCKLCVEQYLTDHAVAVRFSTSRATVWRWVEKNLAFPKPVKLSPGATRWKLSDLLQYEAQISSERAARYSDKMAGGTK